MEEVGLSPADTWGAGSVPGVKTLGQGHAWCAWGPARSGWGRAHEEEGRGRVVQEGHGSTLPMTGRASRRQGPDFPQCSAQCPVCEGHSEVFDASRLSPWSSPPTQRVLDLNQLGLSCAPSTPACPHSALSEWHIMKWQERSFAGRRSWI